jgi:ppGpp synthetase/RelA/SpoT-type nucleotidyltranferase
MKTIDRRRRRPVAALALATFLASNTGTLAFTAAPAAPTTSFTNAATALRPNVATFFRNNDLEFTATQFDFCTSTTQQHTARTHSDEMESLPGWLSVPKAYRSHESMRQLQQSMHQSNLFSDLETRKLIYAVEVAAGDDDQLVAGASEFLLILVQMELGYSALVAAAFHYCASVRARRRGGFSSDGRKEMPLVDVPVSEMMLFGEHAVEIAKDGARLKQLELVAAKVTPNTGIRSPNVRDAENLRKLLLSSTTDWRGLAIRCAASLYRLRGLEELNRRGKPQLTRETIRESREALMIYAPLASRLGMRWLKNELENSAFKLLYRRQYRRVQSYELFASMEQVLTKVKSEMTDLLANDSEFSSMVKDFSVTARVKEPYSMWNKMLRHKYNHVLQVPDALALRVVLNARKLSPDEPSQVTQARERALCYYAQKLCMARWKPSVNPRLKDYIEQPKPNGYQSLHYTAQNEEDWTLEIQVRSGQMHQIAEFGLASHWDYKAQQSTTRARQQAGPDAAEARDSRSSDAYVRKVQEWHWQQRTQPKLSSSSPDDHVPSSLGDIWQSKQRQDRIRDRTQRLEPYLNALTETQSDLARDYVFVFLRSDEHPGRVLALPSGACVLDALREGEKAVGCPLVFNPTELVVNGSSTSVTRQLNNGDVLSLPLCVA